MKRIRHLLFVLVIAIAVLSFSACEMLESIPQLEGVTDKINSLLGKEDQNENEGENNNENSENQNGNQNGDQNENQDGNKDENQNVDAGNGDNTAYETITIAEALELCGEKGNITTERYYIRATVKSITNPAYGAMVIEDETGSIPVYGTYSSDGEKMFSALDDTPVKGDIVLLHCILQNYNGTKEVQNARLIEFEHVAPDIDLTQYPDVSILEARNKESGEKVKVDGVVARITYANGMKPNGVIIVDETSSIYVFDGDIAGQVSIGNKITVVGEKTYWVLDTEQNAANTFGYKGACQIASATLVENDKGNSEFNKTWIKESTVKDIIDTPVTENITSEIFKVTSLVKKVPGTGFTNYYFFDLDETTSTYTYTQCNGNDFAWLDEFDGKVCTVYITALNAKSTSSSCYFRFLPIAVEEVKDFSFAAEDVPEFIVNYYGIGQFFKTYTGDPAAEVTSSVSSALLGFENATITYTSDNTDTVHFTEENGKTIFHCGLNGSAVVTITGTYGDYVYNATVTIAVLPVGNFEYISVAEAIATEVGETVVVKGIVGPSLVNKCGFYLIDEESVIAVTTDAETIATLEIGHEVIIEAKRDRFYQPQSKYTDHNGQTCLTGATVCANYFGNNE